jgi:CheY-like chemotaxis protein
MTESLGKILIVDDDSRNIFALSAVLRARKYDCIAASDMTEALSTLISRPDIRVILLDMMMPDMDGYEAIPMIRKMEGYTQVPIIAVTAQAMVGDKERCLAAGADGYVPKPVEVDELVRLLHQYLKQ